MITMPLNSLSVFLNYASGDFSKVKRIYEFLKFQKIKVWFDKENLLPGQDWNFEIVNAINKADIILVCISSNSISKEGFVQKEIKQVLNQADEKPDGTIFLIPLRLDNCDVPFWLGRWQWVDYFDPTWQDKLMTSLRLRAVALKKPLNW